MKTRGEQPKLVVGVGASAGGLEAFKKLLSALPDDSGMAFLLVQHLDPNHESLLPELLSPCTGMTVQVADEGQAVQPNFIYIIRPDTALGVHQGKLEVSAPTRHRGVRLPVDHLFRSLAREYGPRAVAIILSGAGSDGSSGLREIKAGGGLAIAQEPETSGQTGMPRSAIDTGVIDLILPIEDMPEALERFMRLPPQVRRGGDLEGEPSEQMAVVGPAEEIAELDDQRLEQLSALLSSQIDFDLNVYKPTTVRRRVMRRMVLSGFGDPDAYLDHLRSELTEQQTLTRDLLIGVTDFFRNPDAFRALREQVIDPLVDEVSDTTELRVWVPGCSTGEEAYSLGMELLDAIEARGRHLALHIFATDVDQEALAIGRMGIYSHSSLEGVDETRLQRYFRQLEGKGYQVLPSLRDLISFAPHDLTKDPPFSRMHLVSCRNVMIYLTPLAQAHVLKVLHFALHPGGHLFLSNSESTGAGQDLFLSVSKPWRIYERAEVERSRRLHYAHPQLQGRSRPGSDGAGIQEHRRPRRPSEQDLAQRAVLSAWVPPSIVVSADGSVLFMHGELSPYLRFPEGKDLELELPSLLRPELATRVRGALYTCRRNREAVVAWSSPDSGVARVRITAKPAADLLSGTVVLSFEGVSDDGPQTLLEPESPAQEALVEQLEAELQATRGDLRTTVEELEVSNEELRSSNEESMSMNEELQSANEELEATTEELRSINEELTTVNVQLREKVEQLEQAHNDLNNFFSSTKVATVFFDEHLRVKRFTPAAKELLQIDHGEVGRRIGDIARFLLQEELADEATEVLEHLSTITREVQTEDDRWVIRQVLPYRTDSRQIAGVVVTFTDITDRKRASETLALRERQQAMIARMGLDALRETDLQGFLERAVRDVQHTLDTDYCKILELQPGGETLLLRVGLGWQEGLVGNAVVGTGPDSQAGYTLQCSEPVIVEDLATEKRFSGPDLLVEHQVVSGVSAVIRYGDHDYGVIGAHTRQRRVFSPEDAYFVQAVASVVGSALGRHQTRLRLALELSIAQTLTEIAPIGEALSKVLACFSAKLGTCVGEIWWPDEGGGGLSRRLLQVDPVTERDEIARRLHRETFGPCEGLVGLVYTEARALWCTDLSNQPMFLRRDSIHELGLVTGFGLPLLSGGTVLGVLTVFARDRLFADEVLLRVLEGIGRTIGDFIARAEFEQRAKRLAAITEASHDAIISYDSDGQVSEWLAGAELLFGYSAQEMVGSSIERIVPVDRREELWAANARIRQGERVEPFETIRRCKDGSLVEVSVRSSPVLDPLGNVMGISSTDRDVTHLKETKRRLVDADRQKDEFLAMLGHELRNPLSAIRSATEVLRLLYADDPKLKRTQAILERQTAHMAKLLDGLLDVSRIIRGKIRLEPVVVDFSAVCREVVSDVLERIPKRTLELSMKVPEESLWVKADRIRLAQIVDNLLSNAVKYTDEGTIELTLTRQNRHAKLVVRDSGVGIEPELLPHVFDVFRQSKQSLDRSRGGLGLGLALVRSLSELHGGRVEAHSEGIGHGASFAVVLPITREAPELTDELEPSLEDALDILLVEDNKDSANLLCELLEMSGHQVWVAHLGRTGVNLARERKPDVIICDLGLPDGMTGFDVAQEIRGDRALDAVHLIALSGYGRPEDKARSRECGFDEHITKPVDIKMLERTLAELAVHKRASAAG